MEKNPSHITRKSSPSLQLKFNCFLPKPCSKKSVTIWWFGVSSQQNGNTRVHYLGSPLIKETTTPVWSLPSLKIMSSHCGPNPGKSSSPPLLFLPDQNSRELFDRQNSKMPPDFWLLLIQACIISRIEVLLHLSVILQSTVDFQKETIQ